MRKLFTALFAASLLLGCTSPTASPSASSTSPAPTASIEYETFEVFFVTDTPKGFRLVSELRDFPVSDQTATDVLAGLINGEVQPLDSDYTNLWGETNQLLSIDESESLLTLDLSPIQLNVGAEAEARAIEQLVWTATAVIRDIPIQFTVDGKFVETFAGHVDTSVPFERNETYEVLNDVQLTYPNQDEVVSNPLVVQGMACTFEANVVWELWSLDGVDTLVDSGSTTAEIACPDRSTFQVHLGELESGAYEIKVMDYSAKDGALTSIDTKTFSVE